MSLDRKNDDVEELSLDDAEVELKIKDLKLKPTEVSVENLDFDASSDLGNNENKDDYNNENGPDDEGEASSSNDSKSDMAPQENSASSDLSTENDESNIDGSEIEDNKGNYNPESLEENNGLNQKEDKNKQDDSNKKPENYENKQNDFNKKPEGDENNRKDSDGKSKNDNENKNQEDKQKKENGQEKDNNNNKDNKNNDKPNTNKPDNNKPQGNRPGQNKKSLKDKPNDRPTKPKGFGNRAKNYAKNKAQDAFNNSRTGQAINKGKDLVDKGKKAADGAKKVGSGIKSTVKFLSTPAGWYVLGGIAIGLAALILILVVPSLLASGSPGLGGEVENEENYSKYSEVDQKTIEKLKEITEKYPTGDPSYAMAATLYPYIEEMQNGNVASLRGKTNETQEDDEDIYDDEDKKSNEEDTDDLKDNENDTTADDPYLELFQKRKYRNKFKKLLKESKNGEDALTSYLKDTWFKKDAGYKELFDDATDDDELSKAIIDDLLSQKDDFLGYFFENCNTVNASTTALTAAGNVSNFNGSIYVTLRDYFADSDGYFRANSYYNSPALYQTDSDPLTFARYIMGVVYAESESCLDSESCAKSLMITAKSFAIGRQSSQGYTPEVLEDRTIIHMRGNVGDQDFCDVYEGCKEGRFSKETWNLFTGEGYKNRKGPLASDKLSNLEKWWNDIADQYVIRKEDNKFAGNQYNDYNDSCKKGSCVSQTRMLNASKSNTDYMNLLFNSNNGGFDNTSYTLYSSSSNELYAVTTGDKVCSNEGLTGSRQDIVNFATSMVSKIPYYFYEGQSDGYGALGHALSKNFEDNHFNEKSTTYTDHKGRDKYGLDCSGFVDFVFWNALDNNLGNGNTDSLKSQSAKIEYSELKPGDLGFLNDGSSGTEQHVGIYVGNDEWVELNPSGVTKGPYPNFKVYYRPNILADLDAKEMIQGDGVSTGSMSSPIKDKTLSCSDYPNYSSGSYHGGTDLSVSVGTEVLAVDGGEVITSKDLEGCDGRNCVGGYYSYGRYIEIKHDSGLTSLYAHLSERLVKEGDKVSKGQLIGKSGENGNTTGPHLHLEIKMNGNNQNPCNYVK